MSPELPMRNELRAIDRMIDTDIDFAIEEKHLHEIDVQEGCDE